MLIKSYGLFWRTEEIEWSPGSGRQWRMLGRHGANRPGLHVADFRDQHGLYVLYGNYGARYVGLARQRGLGDRLKDHLSDHHAGEWDRFSWFGFRRTLVSIDRYGLRVLSNPAINAAGQRDDLIGDMEALLIKALGLSHNFAEMRFRDGTEYAQVTRLEVEHGLLGRARVELP